MLKTKSKFARLFIVCFLAFSFAQISACSTANVKPAASEQVAMADSATTTDASTENTAQNAPEEKKFSPWGIIGAVIGFALGLAVL